MERHAVLLAVFASSAGWACSPDPTTITPGTTETSITECELKLPECAPEKRTYEYRLSDDESVKCMPGPATPKCLLIPVACGGPKLDETGKVELVVQAPTGTALTISHEPAANPNAECQRKLCTDTAWPEVAHPGAKELCQARALSTAPGKATKSYQNNGPINQKRTLGSPVMRPDFEASLMGTSTFSVKDRSSHPNLAGGFASFKLSDTDCNFLDAPDAPGTCGLAINAIRIIYNNFGFEGFDIREMTVSSTRPFFVDNVVRPAGHSTVSFSLPDDLWFDFTALVDGVRRSTPVKVSGSSEGTVDLLTGVATFSLGFDGKNSDGVPFSGSGMITTNQASNRGPFALAGADVVANAGAAPGCTAPITLDGSRSFDLDGAIPQVVWASDGNKLGDTLTTTANLGLGQRDVSLLLRDASGSENVDLTTVQVNDVSPPQITLQPLTSNSCRPEPSSVAIPDPTVEDCSGVASVSGALIAVNGRALPSPVPIGNHSLVLPVGTHTVRWEATDKLGLSSHVEQSIVVSQNVDETCCAPGQTVLQGTEGQDALTPASKQPYCVLAKGGGDQVVVRGASDFVSGGPGQDMLTGNGGQDILIGGLDNDHIVGNTSLGGTLYGYGGPGDDALHANFSAQSFLYGGPGNDNLTGSPGADLLVPGAGVDAVYGEAGNDTVVIYDLCELAQGKALYGGAGFDTLIIPVSLAALQGAGVQVSGFESVVVDDTNAYLSECFAPVPTPTVSCNDLPAWKVGSYVEGARVKSAGAAFECRPWPNSGWCGQIGYQPGVAAAWQDAWLRMNTCQ